MYHRAPLVEFLYDVLQRVVGADVIRNRLRPHLLSTSGQRVLDVGAGTGLYASALPSGAQHVWLDRDSAKLQRFRARFPQHRQALLADGAAISLTDDSVHTSICTNVLHHLTDEELQRLLRELSRVTRERIVIEDPLETGAFISGALWSIDRGSHPRSRTRLLQVISDVLRIDRVEEFKVLHTYLLVVCRPTS